MVWASRHEVFSIMACASGCERFSIMACASGCEEFSTISQVQISSNSNSPILSITWDLLSHVVLKVFCTHIYVMS